MIVDTSVIVALAGEESTVEWIRGTLDARSRFPLNFGDCFAYAHARLRNEALITLDDGFLATDLGTVLHPRQRATFQSNVAY